MSQTRHYPIYYKQPPMMNVTVQTQKFTPHLTSSSTHKKPSLIYKVFVFLHTLLSMPRPSNTKKGTVQQGFIVEAQKRLQDPMLQKPVAFDIKDENYGKDIYQYFQAMTKNAEKLQTTLNIIGDRSYLFGSVAKEAKRKGSIKKFYDVQWEHDFLGTTTIDLPVVLAANELYCQLVKSSSPRNNLANFFDKSVRKSLSLVDKLNQGFDPYDSNDFDNSDTDSNDSVSAYTISVDRHPPMRGEASQDGYRWSAVGQMGPPPDISKRRETHINPKFTGYFQTPISSFLAFIPLKMFNAFAIYSNKYAHESMAITNNNNISGARWTHDIDLQEMMTFFGILLKMVLRPMTGKSYTSCWGDKNWHPYTSAMELRRFQQIRSVLHFNDNSRIQGCRDAVFKVRPLKIADFGIYFNFC